MLAALNITGLRDIPSMSSGILNPARSINVGVCELVLQIYLPVNDYCLSLTRSMLSAI